jgi:hypothetical protein
MISPGESWTHEISNPRLPSARGVVVNTLERLDERSGQVVAVVRREMDLEIPDPLPWPTMGADLLNMRAHMSMESHLLLDGMVPLREIYEVEIESRAHVTGQSPDGPLDITGSISLRIEGEMNLISGD